MSTLFFKQWNDETHSHDLEPLDSDKDRYATILIRLPDGAEVEIHHEKPDKFFSVRRISSGELLIAPESGNVVRVFSNRRSLPRR